LTRIGFISFSPATIGQLNGFAMLQQARFSR